MERKSTPHMLQRRMSRDGTLRVLSADDGKEKEIELLSSSGPG